MDDRNAILNAAFELLCERGFGGMTMDEIAVRAGVHSYAVHSNWRSRSELVAELLRYHSDEPPELPDTGELRADLTVVTGRLVETFHSLRVLVANAMGEASRDPELARELRLFVYSWQAMARRLVARAIERGELPAALSEERAVDLLTAIVWFRILLVGDLARQAVHERLLDEILEAWGHV
jgi:AcrR family transcriptional regulator